MIARASIAFFFCLVLAAPVLAADPPVTVNYQGVLRDSQNKPVTGGYNMIFRFFDDESFGNELLVDTHTGGLAVAVTNGVFNVALGGGVVSDGAGPGAYASLADVFGNNQNVWLQITVGIDTLFPRIRVRSSAYALNSATLQGRPAASFIDTSATFQQKNGPLWISNPSGIPMAAINGANGNSAVLADISHGIIGHGNFDGGWFTANNGSSTIVASTNHGIFAEGRLIGGVFYNQTGSGNVHLADGDTGMDVQGRYPAPTGHFKDSAYTGEASLAWGDTGIVAKGSYAGGEFDNTATGRQAMLATDGAAGYFNHGAVWTYLVDVYGYGLATNGLKDFVQNHPSNPDRVIAYTALEGPEAGTYTRGSGVLHGGEAHVALDPTFALTTDPDIGITAMVTPRGAGSLYVASVSTSEMVVRSSAPVDRDLSFDYVVNGLRLGFENHPTILPAAAFPTATVPSLEAASARLAAQPEDVRGSTPLARFTANRGAGERAPDLKGARDLIAGIDSPNHVARPVPARAVPQTGDGTLPMRPAPRTVPATGTAPSDTTARPAPDPAAEPPGSPRFDYAAPVQGTVEAGSIVSNDPSSPGTLRLADVAGDAGVIGVVAGPAGSSFSGMATIAPAGTIVWCRVDATEKPVALNDLLVASASPGYAMSAGAEARQGTVIGKALEPLGSGTGSIRILVMSR